MFFFTAQIDNDGSHVPLPNYTNSTITPTTPTTPTTPKTTTPTPTTPSTPAPNTTTTEKTTTTSSTTPSTTTPTKPTTPTTTAQPTTTTEKPIPVPPKPSEPVPGTWTVNYTNSNRSCIVVEFAAQIEIPYPVPNTNLSFIGYLNVLPNATVNGSCTVDNNTQEILLTWNKTMNGTNQMWLTFAKKNVNSTKYDLASVKLSVYTDNGTFPGIGSKYLIYT